MIAGTAADAPGDLGVPAEPLSSRAPRVLVVDDDADNRDVLEQELELLGCAAVAAAGGSEALDRLGAGVSAGPGWAAAAAVDLVLLDVMMPGIDGIEVLRCLKADPRLRDLPVVMISALNDVTSVARCIELGAEDYLPKPFDPVLLKARVGACLEKKRWRDREAAYLARIKRQLEAIERESARADRLLHVILPAPAVAELKATGRVTARRHENVAVLFADIVGFTPYCEAHPPEAVVAELDRLIEACEGLIGAHGLEKIKTIGDGIVATANLLRPHADPVMAAVRCGLAMVGTAREIPPHWRLRVGVHVGPVMAGTVGRGTFGFDIWGDAVNLAARLAGLGDRAAVHLTREAWARAAEADGCRGRALGRVPLKGKGLVEVYRCDAV